MIGSSLEIRSFKAKPVSQVLREKSECIGGATLCKLMLYLNMTNSSQPNWFWLVTMNNQSLHKDQHRYKINIISINLL